MRHLPPEFLYSQSNLSDWEQCRRRFLYKNIEHRAYPAPETADMLAFEHHMAQGDRFHRMVQQYLSGVDASLITNRTTDDQLTAWWSAFLASGLNGIPPRRHAEAYLSAPLGRHRLIAKYDLIAADPQANRLVIIDWKTSRHRPSREILAGRLQTTVYRYLMVRAGAYYLDWSPVQPEHIEMIYWFTNFPHQPERFTYSAQDYARDEARLTDLVAQIETADAFPKVPDAERERACRFCVYRSLCWDDVLPGDFADMDPDDTAPATDLAIDLDQIAEIEF